MKSVMGVVYDDRPYFSDLAQEAFTAGVEIFEPGPRGREGTWLGVTGAGDAVVSWHEADGERICIQSHATIRCLYR